MATTQPSGYLALPPDGTGRGVLVLHPWWGLNDTIRGVCDRLATVGFVAFAPDLYHGQVTDQIAEAERLVGELQAKEDQAWADVTESITFLQERARSPQIAVMGFSLGASFALEASGRDPERIDKVVVFYGTGSVDEDRARASYLGHFAANDPYESPEYIQQLEEALTAAGRPVTFYTYPNTGHWFFESDRADAYNREATELAWERTLAFLREG